MHLLEAPVGSSVGYYQLSSAGWLAGMSSNGICSKGICSQERNVKSDVTDIGAV